MTLHQAVELEPRPPGTTVYRPKLGMWLFYGFCALVGCFLLWVAFYEQHTDRDRWVVIAGAAGTILLVVDLSVARVRLDQESVQIHGFFVHNEFTYREVAGPPDTLGWGIQKRVLQQRLTDGRAIRFPIWLGAPERREIVGKIEAHRRHLGS